MARRLRQPIVFDAGLVALLLTPAPAPPAPRLPPPKKNKRRRLFISSRH